MTLAAPATAQRAHALSLLLTRYVAGHIADAQMSAVSDLLDGSDATVEERLAFTRFYLDALSEGDERLALPEADELADFLHLARA